MITPQGTVYMGTVPWTPAYGNVWYEGMMTPSTIVSTFLTTAAGSGTYSFIRESTDIRVPFNADIIYGFNYVGYQNSGKWFFAFVETITYVNNNVSLLHLVEDAWHTWGQYIVPKACLVRREHVSTDTPGAWRAPEPNLSLEGVTLTAQEFNDLTYNAIVIGTNAIPHLKANQTTTIFDAHTADDFLGSDPVAGGMFNTIYSGAAYYGFTNSELTALTNFLNNLNLCGAAESVCCMYMVPGTLLTTNSDHEVTSYGTSVTGSFQAPTYSAGSYTPRNKKCLTFPYCYATITDFSGSEMDIKYEDCNVYGTVSYGFAQGMDPTASLFLTMHDYMGQSIDYSHSMPIAQNPQCAWSYNGYQNWLAQNASSLQLKTEVGTAEQILGGGLILGGLALAFTPLGAALELGATAAAGAVGGGLSALASGMKAQADVKNEITVQSKTPAHRVGTPSGNSLQGIARNEGGYIAHGLTLESAQRLDSFFDVFGYEIDQVKVPNLTGRPNWNYVQTEGACFGGTIPADRLALMNACLDRGITFWHTSDVGNYALSNGVV